MSPLRLWQKAAQQRGGLTDREGEKDVMGKTGTETDVKHKSSLDLAHPCAVEKAFSYEIFRVAHIKTQCCNWEPSNGHCQAGHFGKHKFLYLSFPGSSQRYWHSVLANIYLVAQKNVCEASLLWNKYVHWDSVYKWYKGVKLTFAVIAQQPIKEGQEILQLWIVSGH